MSRLDSSDWVDVAVCRVLSRRMLLDIAVESEPPAERDGSEALAFWREYEALRNVQVARNGRLVDREGHA